MIDHRAAFGEKRQLKNHPGLTNESKGRAWISPSASARPCAIGKENLPMLLIPVIVGPIGMPDCCPPRMVCI
jgi:hypothetical protein